MPEVIGETGLIIDEEDTAALNRALQGLLTDPSRARTIGASARKRGLEEYGDGPVAQKMVELWRRVTG